MLCVKHKVIQLKNKIYWSYIQTWAFDLEPRKSIVRSDQTSFRIIVHRNLKEISCRMRLKGLIEGAVDHQGGGVAAIGGAGETHFEVRKRILNTREMKLKRMLEKLRNQRILLRNKRQKLEYPVIAVVGYTNAGKDLIHYILYS
jgi:hypothetical protein